MYTTIYQHKGKWHTLRTVAVGPGQELRCGEILNSEYESMKIGSGHPGATLIRRRTSYARSAFQ